MNDYEVPIHRVMLVKEGKLMASPQLRNSDTTVALVRPLCDQLDREAFWVIALDTKNKLIGVNQVSVGTLNQNIVHPREIFKYLALCSAAAFIAVHNHPSGDPTPSIEDERITSRLKLAGNIMGIKMLDHIVVGETGYYSFANAGRLEEL